MVPTMSSRPRLSQALDATMHALQLADDRGDEDAIWAGIQDVLTCLYRFEEQERRSGGSGYYRDRGSSTGGQIVGGLIWLRGLILLNDVEVRSHLFRPSAIAGGDNSPQPLTVLSVPGGQLVFVDDVVWPERRQLPAPGRRYKAHHRDRYYDQHIAGQSLMGPLRAAQSYFVGERAESPTYLDSA